MTAYFKSVAAVYDRRSSNPALIERRYRIS
jgi:hypothetical protein